MGEIDSKHFTLERVSKYVYAAIAKNGSGSVANAGFVDLGDNLIIFDTFNTQQASEELKSIAEKVTNHSVTWVVNSHWHGDHIRGNQTFRGRNIISSEITYSKMKKNHPSRINKQKNDIQGLSNYIDSLIQKQDKKFMEQINFLCELKKSLPTLELELPNKTFKGELTFRGTNCIAKIFSLGGGHSSCDSMMYIPDEKVIFMGDLLFVNCHPTFFEESNLDNWVEILKKVELMVIDVAISGHGSIGTKKDLLKMIDYINELKNVVGKNNNIEEIEMPAKYRDWSSPEVYHQNLKLINETTNTH